MTDEKRDMSQKDAAPLDMHDPDDRELHTKKGTPPYPKPAKTTVKDVAQDDTADPADTDPDAPHDRGAVRDGEYEGGVEAMRRKVDDDKAWREGMTQD